MLDEKRITESSKKKKSDSGFIPFVQPFICREAQSQREYF